MTEAVVNMGFIDSNTREKNEKTVPTPQQLQSASSDLCKQFALIIQSIKTPGLTGESLLKAMQEYQNNPKNPSGPSSSNS